MTMRAPESGDGLEYEGGGVRGGGVKGRRWLAVRHGGTAAGEAAADQRRSLGRPGSEGQQEEDERRVGEKRQIGRAHV